MKTLKKLVSLVCAVSALSVANGVLAQGYPWRNHDPNYSFLFGNDFDTHQQTRLMPSGSLMGFFYVRYTGDVTADGYPMARHANCNDVDDCRVGWILRGERGGATFLYHVMGDHPTWQADRGEIPQPGAFSHFHFLGEHPTQTGEWREGYFIELQATDRFCFLHHDTGAIGGTCADIGGVAVNPGIDIATHVNIVGSAPVPMPH